MTFEKDPSLPTGTSHAFDAEGTLLGVVTQPDVTVPGGTDTIRLSAEDYERIVVRLSAEGWCPGLTLAERMALRYHFRTHGSLGSEELYNQITSDDEKMRQIRNDYRRYSGLPEI
jgi:hypothetical protein